MASAAGAQQEGMMVRRVEGVIRPGDLVQESAPNDREEIARVAYELFQRRGGTHGRDQQDWFEAERLVRQQRRVNWRSS